MERLAHLLVVVGGLVAAVVVAPIGTDVAPDGSAPDPTPAPARLSPADARLAASGREAPIVGRASPAVEFFSFDGAPVSLHDRNRPVVLLFLGPPCRDCEAELSKAAVVATILFEEAWVGILASPGAAATVQRAVSDAGAGDLVLAGVDEGDAIARGFDVSRMPYTIVLDADARVAAAWPRSVPATVILDVVRGL
jgi:thiol-disulfide isomerase/thioredoxin